MITHSLSTDGTILSVHVPIKLRRRGGRKLIIGAPGAPCAQPAAPQPASPLIKAVARAHRWKRLLESGQCSSIIELAKAERVDLTYARRLLKLTLLAPDIIEAILNHRLPRGIGLPEFFKPWPALWDEQRAQLRRLADEPFNPPSP